METETSKPYNTSCDSSTIKKKRKKKKKKRIVTSSNTSESTVTERSQRSGVLPLPPIAPLPTTRGRRCSPRLQLPEKKDAEQAPRSVVRRRRRKDFKSPAPPIRPSSSSSRVSRPERQAHESLRWEGALDDPEAEERRLEVYKANRRQRYIAHMENMQKDNQDKPKQREKRP